MPVYDNITGHRIDPDNEAAWPAELISQSVLIQLTEKVWINPQHVVDVEFYAKDHMTSADDPRVIIHMLNGNHVVRNTTIGVIVALINGDAP